MASHKLNTQSSRSHCILTLKIESINKADPDSIISAKLHLVDLAGSERQSQTGTEGQNFKECIEINKSLFTLRQVINSLAEQSTQSQQEDYSPVNNNANKQIHVPYRDSKLTSLLKQSIGGNSYCLMIACLSPCDIYSEENISTLNYATKASQISNEPIKNEDPKNRLITELKTKVSELTKDLARANEHIAFLSKFSTDNINKYGTDILKMQKPKVKMTSSLKQIQEEKVTSETKQENTNKNQNKEEIENQQKMDETPKKEQIEQTSNKSNLQQNVQKSLNLMGSELSIDGGLMSSDMIIRRLVESANMVRDLLQSNINMREMIEKLTKNNESIEGELNILQLENSDLREKIDIMENIFSQDIENEKEQQNKFDYRKVLEDSELNTKSDQKMTNGFQKNNQTFTSSFGFQTTTRQEIVNEIHQLRKEKKNLSERLKLLELENNELHTKLNPNILYGEPTRMHLNQTLDMFTQQNQPQQMMYHLPPNYKPSSTKQKKGSLGSRLSAKNSMNVVDEFSPQSSSQQTNQYNSMLSTQQQFQTLYQTKLNISNNQPIFNQTMYYNNLRKHNSTATESPKEEVQMRNQLYTRTSSQSKYDQSFTQNNRLPSTGARNLQNNSYNAGDSSFTEKQENSVIDLPQYSNFARNTPSFNQPQTKLYETTANGWINTTPVIYPNQQNIAMMQTQYSNGSGNNIGNFSTTSNKRNSRAFSQNSKRPPIVKSQMNKNKIV